MRAPAFRSMVILVLAWSGASPASSPISGTLSPGMTSPVGEAPELRGPSFLQVDSATGELLVLCEKSGTLAIVDPVSGTITSESEVGGLPFALVSHPDGQRVYVSCRDGQEVVEMDIQTLETLRRFPLRGDPTGVAVSADGDRLYVGLHSLDQLAVLDLNSGAEIKRLTVGNGPLTVRLSPSESLVYVTNLLTNPVPPDQPCQLEITVIDDHTARIADRIILKNANIGREIAFTSDGSLAIAAISRPKNLVPMVQVARGWVITNGFVILSPQTKTPPIQLLVDQPNRGYSDPHALVITPDDSKFYVAAAGADMVLSIDLAAARAVAQEAAAGNIPRYADHLGLSRRYVTSHISVGANPRALAISPDGKWLYVANRLDDSISVIEIKTDQVVKTWVLGRPPPPDRLLLGERLFHSAARTFQEQFICASCHPDGGFDGLQYDLEPDGIGENVLDNRNLRGVGETEPFKWVGSNPDIATQCGTRTAKWIVRTNWLRSSEVVALSSYIHSIRPVVNPYQSPDGKLSPTLRRGKKFFERTTTNDGTPIPEANQCHVCHSGPYFTNREQTDVGTRSSHDTKSKFDTAHLTNIFESPPFLHDGRAATLEEIWTLYNPEGMHGISSDWTKQQLNDLVEYLKSIGGPEEIP